ncbi:hypothetical protein [Microbulbifer aggregans]|uniref:capsular polysaccharide export protein, LipB/KpsS family n=1 Tax=Microbulbifer aggregans TaxID=1769779 RepID=UPI001CFCF3FA|nr:hypothetical protein [Microbulbifer aggregans]
MKKVLIYEPMPDILRADHICAIAQREIEKGHQVLLLLEEEVQVLYRNSVNKPHSVYCKNIIRAKIADTGIPFFALPRNKRLKNQFRATPEETLKDIRDYRTKHFENIILDFNPDSIMLWNGLIHYQQDFIRLSKALNPNQKYLFIEAGWFPQKGTFYIDPMGVNAKSSIARKSPVPISENENRLIEQWKSKFRESNGNYIIKDKGYIFVPLQLETDTNITLFSPLKKMEDLLRWADKNTPKHLKIIARPHPLNSKIPDLAFDRRSSRVLLDSQTDLYQLIAECTAVLGINSTTLLESLIFDKPVFALGEGIFQSSHAIQKQELTEKLKPTKNKNKRRSSNSLLSALLKKQESMPRVSTKSFTSKLKPSTKTTRYNRLETLFSKVSIHLKIWAQQQRVRLAHYNK